MDFRFAAILLGDCRDDVRLVVERCADLMNLRNIVRIGEFTVGFFWLSRKASRPG
jgi:hypothetical protein